MMRENTRITTCGAALMMFGLLGGTASSQEVGKASAVNPAATSNLRTISIGSSIAHKERIQTTAAGSVQLLFLDKTSMTIGPNSDLVIDEYVYDPNAGSGTLVATLGKGALRFVGGQVSHTGHAEIKTASTVIGIRGGVALITHHGTQTETFAGYGRVTVNSGGTSVTLPAGSYTHAGGGNPPAPPASPPAGFVSAQLQLFQSSGGQTGGALPGRATAAAIHRAEARATGTSKGTVARVATVGANGTVRVTSTSNSSSPDQTTDQTQFFSNINQTVQTSAQSAAVTQSLQQYAGAAFVLNSTNCCDPTNTSPVPYVPANFATGPGYVSPMLGYRSANPAGTAGPNPALTMQFGIGINGVGPLQSSWMFLNEGGFLSDGKGGLAFTSGFDAFRMGSSTLAVGYSNGSISSPLGAVAADSDLIPTGASVQNLRLNPQTMQYFSETPLNDLGDGSPKTPYTISQRLTQGTLPTGLGTNRPAVTLAAFVGGVMATYDETAARYLAPSFAVSGNGAIVLDPTTSRVQATFIVGNITPGTGTDELGAALYQFGSLSGPGARGAYIDYNNFSARAAHNTVDPTTGKDVPTSMVVTQGGTLSSLNYHGGFIVAATPAVQQQIAPALNPTGVNFCQCDYTRWGFWGSASSRTSTTSSNSITDIGTLMTWVAGQLPGINDIPKTGIATYDGMVVANIKNGTSQYMSGGNFTNAVNFGTQTGNVTVTKLDNSNYSGTVSFNPSDPRAFTGPLSGTNTVTGYPDGRSMVVNGSFFKGAAVTPGGVPAAVSEMGGNVVIQGTNYLGSGIFAAKAR